MPTHPTDPRVSDSKLRVDESPHRDAVADADDLPRASNKSTNEVGEHPTLVEGGRRVDLLSSGAGPPAMETPDFTGRQFGNYTLQRIVGSGGHGVVYKAYDSALNRDVALKFPRPDVLLNVDGRRRFEAEAKTAAGLDHPAIVRVFEAELGGATTYIASAYCAGTSLAQWLSGDRQLQGCLETAAFIEELASAVHYAHEQGVVHRDLKPGNVLLSPIKTSTDSRESLSCFQPRLTDFGLAQLAEGRLEDTRSSLMVGTPLYMSPEQASDQRREIGPASDIFSLGAILYHLLTGDSPFAADTYFAVLTRVREVDIEPISSHRVDVDKDLDIICMKCLQRLPEDRYATAAEFAEDLRRYLDGQPIAARPLNTAQMLLRWSHQRARVGEAMGAVILISLTRAAFGLIGLVMVQNMKGMNATDAELVEILMAQLVITTPLEVWIVWAASRNAAKKLSPHLYWLAFATLVLFCFTAFLIAVGVVQAPLWYQRSFGARVLVFSIIGLLFATQAVCWHVADWKRIDAREPTPVRRRVKLALIGAAIIVFLLAMLLRDEGPLESSPLAGPADSISMDGIDDYLAVDSVGFLEKQPFTLETWVRPDESRKSIIVQYGPISLGTVSTADGNRLRIQVSSSPESLYLLDTSGEFANKQWAHLAVTYDQKTLRCFLNGKPRPFDVSVYQWSDDSDEADVRAIESLPKPLVLNDVWPGADVFIGSNRGGTQSDAFYFAGQIGEVRLTRGIFYRGAFSPNPRLSTSKDTEFLFRFDQHGGSTVPDETGHFTARAFR